MGGDVMDGLDRSGNVDDPVAWLNANPEAPQWLRQIVALMISGGPIAGRDLLDEAQRLMFCEGAPSDLLAAATLVLMDIAHSLRGLETLGGS